MMPAIYGDSYQIVQSPGYGLKNILSGARVEEKSAGDRMPLPPGVKPELPPLQ
jgi:hypothetical protein